MLTGIIKRNRSFFIVIWLLVAGILVGCSSNTDPLIVTAAPTDTPTTEPSIAPSPEEVAAAVDVVTSTPVPTVNIVVLPPTAGPSPTSPLGSTYTPRPPTQTATRQPTIVGFSVEFFGTTSQVVRPGDNVDLRWETDGADDVRIYRLDAEGVPEVERPVDLDGQLTINTGSSVVGEVEFVLIARRGEATIEERITVTLNCTEIWFFLPAPEGCPNSPGEPSSQAEQQFEGGFMVWMGITGEIFVFFNEYEEDEVGWIRVFDSFEDGDPERDETIIAPEGRFQPVRGFGQIWRTNDQVRERLGWAIEPESGYDGMLQRAGILEDTQILYMRTRDGGIVELISETNAWRLVPFDNIESTITPTPES